jgi:hypothetical protein
MLILEIFDQTILNNSLLQWLIAVAALLATVVLLRIVQHLAGRRLAALATRTATQWDDNLVALIARTKLLFLIVVSIFVASFFLDLPDRIQSAISNLLVIALFIQSGIWGVTFIARVLETYRQHALENDRAEVTTINLIGLVVWIILVLT